KYFSAPFGTDPASEKLERAARIFGSRSCIMRVCVGHISAHCDKCGCQDFQPLFAESSNAHEMACFSCGARPYTGTPDTNRTCDLPLRRGLLYPLSYRGRVLQ